MYQLSAGVYFFILATESVVGIENMSIQNSSSFFHTTHQISSWYKKRVNYHHSK